MHRLWERSESLMSANLSSTCCLGAWITAQQKSPGTGWDENPPKKSLLQAVGLWSSLLSGCKLSVWGGGAEYQRGAENCTSSRLAASHPAVRPGFDASCQKKTAKTTLVLFSRGSEGAQPAQACASQNLAMPGPCLLFLCDKGALGGREGSALQAQDACRGRE